MHPDELVVWFCCEQVLIGSVGQSFVDQIYNVAKVGDHPSTHPSIHPSEDLAKFGYKLDMKV
jgi:hypothetical protein